MRHLLAVALIGQQIQSRPIYGLSFSNRCSYCQQGPNHQLNALHVGHYFSNALALTRLATLPLAEAVNQIVFIDHSDLLALPSSRLIF